MKKIIILLLITQLYASNIFTQSNGNKITDSLKLTLKSKKGKKLFNTYLEISKQYVRINLDSSKFYAEKAFSLSEKIEDKDIKIEALILLGHTSWKKGDYENAIINFEKSLALGKQRNDSTTIAKAYNGLAIVHSRKGELNKSINYFFNTLTYFEKLKDTAGMATANLNIAVDYRKLKEFKKAIAFNDKSLELYQKIGDTVRVAMVNNNLAGNYNELGEYQKALKYSELSKDFLLKLGYKRFSAYSITNIAISYDSLKKYDLAKKNYLKAIELHTINREPYELAFLNNALSNLYYSNNENANAIDTGKKALSYSEEIKAIEFLASSSKTLAKSYQRIKKYKEAHRYLKKYSIYKDSLVNKEKIKVIKDSETKYETVQKEKEIAQQKEELLAQQLEIKNRSLYATVLGAILLIVAIVFVAIYKRNQLKRKQLQKEIDLKDALATIKTQNRLQEQRLRISRDLHDNIGSQLTFIISSIDNLKYVSKDANQKLKEKLSNISSFTGDTIHQLRDTIWAMNKSEITIEDLHARILSFVEKAKLAVPEITFSIDFNIHEDVQFSSLVGMNLFRAIQEALNNAIKHANPKTIEISLTKKGNEFTVSVKDNGIGFDLNTIDLGNGLSNIEKRMSEIDGKAIVKSALKEGTRIYLSIPADNNIKNG